MSLPSNYIVCEGLFEYTTYVDTGVVPKETLSVNALFSNFANSGYIFGARNSNSNTSAGQLNLYLTQGATCYLGWRSARVSLTNFDTGGYYLHVHSNKNEFEIMGGNQYISTPTGSTGTFTGTRNIYIYGMNNAGTFTGNGVTLHAFQIYDGDTLVRDYIPVYNTNTSQFGVYDFVNDTFSALSTPSGTQTLYEVTITSSTGGSAYAKTFHGENVSSIYAGNMETSGINKARLFAIAKAGYVFKDWTDGNGNIVSTEREITYGATANVTLTANFIKKTDINQSLGFKCMAIKYGQYDANASLRDDFFAEVLSAEITTDLLQKTSTKIVLKEIPSTYQTNMLISLFNPMGKCIFNGIIRSIDGNTITCGEPMSLYDDDFLLVNNTSTNKYCLLYSISNYLNVARSRNYYSNVTMIANPLTQRKYYDIHITDNRMTYLPESKVFNVGTPVINQMESTNLEDYIISLFNDFGVFIKTRLIKGHVGSTNPTRHYFEYVPSFIRENDTIQLSDNVEDITNVSISIEEMENTVLAVFNSSGSSLRGYYGMEQNGDISVYDDTYTDVQLQNFIGYQNYKIKVVTSDDDIRTLVAQELSNSKYNHKITFDLALDNSMFDIDSLFLGQPVNFYYQNRMYESVVTGISYTINENDDNVHSVKVTLGKVRTNLTSKLNLGKVKGKK